MASTGQLFDLPSRSHSFEPEFTGPPPRSVPDSLLDGPYGRRRRTGATVLAAVGAICLLGSRAPGLDVLARYFLPLGYLGWIGVGGLLLAAAVYVPYALRLGDFRYVRHGEPLAARVVQLVKTPTAIVNGAPSQHAFVATVAFSHPQTGAPTQASVKSNDFSSARKDAYDAPFKVGDDVTAVYLPPAPEKTLRLYAFLELSPEVNLRPRTRRRRDDSPWKTALLIAAIPAMFVILFANVYAYGRYEPVQFDHWRAAVPMALGAVLLGGGLVAGLYVAHHAEQRRLRQRALEAAAAGTAVEVGTPFLGHGVHAWVLRAVLAVGGPFLGAGTAMCWAFMANAWLDRSPAQEMPATVEDMTMTTHAFVFREYELKYVLDGLPEKRSLLTTREHLLGFHDRSAVARVRDGRFGWRWVETVSPR